MRRGTQLVAAAVAATMLITPLASASEDRAPRGELGDAVYGHTVEHKPNIISPYGQEATCNHFKGQTIGCMQQNQRGEWVPIRYPFSRQYLPIDIPGLSTVGVYPVWEDPESLSLFFPLRG